MYNIAYHAPDGWRLYCKCAMSLDEAKRQLANFKRLYLNEDGTGRAYPNGKGFYPFTRPAIVRVS
jgi:hypothetical protein